MSAKLPGKKYVAANGDAQILQASGAIAGCQRRMQEACIIFETRIIQAQKSAGAFGGGDEVRRGTDSQQLEYSTDRNLLPFQRKISSTISSLSST